MSRELPPIVSNFTSGYNEITQIGKLGDQIKSSNRDSQSIKLDAELSGLVGRNFLTELTLHPPRPQFIGSDSPKHLKLKSKKDL